MPHGNTKTCSAKCDRDQHWVKLVCPVCLKLFERKQSYVLKAIKKGQKDFYCGSSCVGKVGGRQHGWGKLKGERETEQMLFTNGCSRHQDCFTCPFPDCTVEDKEINKKAVESRHELVRELAQKGKCLAEIAMETHYEQSHVRRILRKETR